jgi:hypothetical protein
VKMATARDEDILACIFSPMLMRPQATAAPPEEEEAMKDPEVLREEAKGELRGCGWVVASPALFSPTRSYNCSIQVCNSERLVM